MYYLFNLDIYVGKKIKFIIKVRIIFNFLLKNSRLVLIYDLKGE